MKKKVAQRIIFILLLFICSFGLMACSKNVKNDKKQEEQSSEEQKPHGNFVMKDEEGNVVITVDDIKSAETFTNDNNGNNEYGVSLKFTDEGVEKFAEVTKQNIGKKISIYVDDEIVSEPMVQTIIIGGEAFISGMETYEECVDLVEKIYQKN